MQIVPFLTHYQLVYANFDLSSFSVISYTPKEHLLQVNQVSFRSQKGMCCFALHENSLQTVMIWEVVVCRRRKDRLTGRHRINLFFCILSFSLSSFEDHLISDSHTLQVYRPLFFQSMDLTEEQDSRHRDGITLLSMLLHIA